MNRQQRNVFTLAAKDAVAEAAVTEIKPAVNRFLSDSRKEVVQHVEIEARQIAGQIKQQLLNGELILYNKDDYDRMLSHGETFRKNVEKLIADNLWNIDRQFIVITKQDDVITKQVKIIKIGQVSFALLFLFWFALTILWCLK